MFGGFNISAGLTSLKDFNDKLTKMKEDMERNIETSLGLDGQAENAAAAAAGSGNSGVTGFCSSKTIPCCLMTDYIYLAKLHRNFPSECELQSKRRVKAQMAGMEKLSFCLTSMDLLW